MSITFCSVLSVLWIRWLATDGCRIMGHTLHRRIFTRTYVRSVGCEVFEFFRLFAEHSRMLGWLLDVIDRPWQRRRWMQWRVRLKWSLQHGRLPCISRNRLTLLFNVLWWPRCVCYVAVGLIFWVGVHVILIVSIAGNCARMRRSACDRCLRMHVRVGLIV